LVELEDKEKIAKQRPKNCTGMPILAVSKDIASSRSARKTSTGKGARGKLKVREMR
jgi:hypothetical protein